MNYLLFGAITVFVIDMICISARNRMLAVVVKEAILLGRRYTVDSRLVSVRIHRVALIPLIVYHILLITLWPMSVVFFLISLFSNRLNGQ